MSLSLIALGKAIVRYRKRKNLTQEALATKSGVTRGHMSVVEQGRGNPEIKTLDKIADVLEVEAWQLLWTAQTGRLAPARRIRQTGTRASTKARPEAGSNPLDRVAERPRPNR